MNYGSPMGAQQAISGMAGMQMAQAAPPTLPPSTISNQLALCLNQAHELRERIANATANICGSVPRPSDGKDNNPEATLANGLNVLSQILSDTLSEVERLQSRL